LLKYLHDENLSSHIEIAICLSYKAELEIEAAAVNLPMKLKFKTFSVSFLLES